MDTLMSQPSHHPKIHISAICSWPWKVLQKRNGENSWNLLLTGQKATTLWQHKSLHSKTERLKTSKKNIFLLLLFNKVSLCKKLEHYLYSFTSGGLICKGWSILLSRLFSTTFPDVHCAKLAINYLIHSIEKQMTSFFKAYLCNFI